MTKFADQLFDDLIREHGPALARTTPSAPRRPTPTLRRIATRRTLLAAGTACAAVAATAGALAAGGGTPAYAVTTNPDGLVTVTLFQASGAAGANARLRQLGDGRVVIVPVKAGCPSLRSLPPPPVPGHGRIGLWISDSPATALMAAKDIPAEDTFVVGFETTADGPVKSFYGAGQLTSSPAPSCVRLPQPPWNSKLDH